MLVANELVLDTNAAVKEETLADRACALEFEYADRPPILVASELLLVTNAAESAATLAPSD